MGFDLASVCWPGRAALKAILKAVSTSLLKGTITYRMQCWPVSFRTCRGQLISPAIGSSFHGEIFVCRGARANPVLILELGSVHTPDARRAIYVQSHS